ncbi:MAG: SAM-dependent methyltransferase, partial [Cyanobacteria bacterium J06588_4]
MVGTVNNPGVEASDNSSQQTKPIARPVTPWGILVQQLEQILEVAQTESISAKFKTALEQSFQLAAGLDPYLESCSTPESPALANLTDRTHREDWSKRFDDGETVKALEQEMLSG